MKKRHLNEFQTGELGVLLEGIEVERAKLVILKSRIQFIYYSTQASGILGKCWLGYKMAKSQDDIERMEYYALRIREAQMELGLQVESFPTLDMWEIED